MPTLLSVKKFLTDGEVPFLQLLQTLLVSFDHFLDHLAADGASLTGGQVTVITVGQVYANLGSSLHLEAVHSFPCLRNIDLIIALHNISLLFFFRPLWKHLIFGTANLFPIATFESFEIQKVFLQFPKLALRKNFCLSETNLLLQVDDAF